MKQAPVARAALDQAVEIAQNAGNPDRGGIAAITAIEELSTYLSTDDLQNYYRTAESLLSNSQNLSLKTRLGECARRVLSVALGNSRVAEPAHSTSETSIPSGFSLDAEVLRYEGSLIRRALEESGGGLSAFVVGVSEKTMRL